MSTSALLYLVEVLFLRPLQLLLEEHNNFLDVSARGHVEHDTDGLSANLQIGTVRLGQYHSMAVSG